MAEPYSVLYVDDEPDLLELGKLFLEQGDQFTVTTAESAAIALELMKDHSFDAIVSDYQMPECNGIHFLRYVRRNSGIPFILFTGKGREEVVIEAINSGVDFYLQKGGETRALFAELGHKINQAISRRNAEKALHRHLDLIRLTSLTATRFIRLPPEHVDAAITQLLGEIGSITGADHCYIALENAGNTKTGCAHEWSSPGSVLTRDQIGSFRVPDFSCSSAQAQKFEPVLVPSVTALITGSGEKGRHTEWLSEIGIRSFVLIPLAIGEEIVGTLGIDSTTKENVVPAEDLDIFRIFGQIIAGALARKAADRTIHESEALYRTVFESTGTAMMILGEDKTVIRANREMERISGYSRDEIENRMPWTRFVSQKDVERMKNYHEMRRANPANVPKNYEFCFLGRDGSAIDTYITVEMIPGTKKSIVSLIDISKERAALQELADSEEKFRCLTGSLAEGIYMIQDTRFIYVNPAFSQITGWPEEELLVLPDFTHLFPEEERPRVRKAVDDRLSGVVSSERYTVRARHRDGSLFPITIHGSLTRYKGKPAIIGSITLSQNT
jgi:PAS domain S-box-containing protein